MTLKSSIGGNMTDKFNVLNVVEGLRFARFSPRGNIQYLPLSETKTKPEGMQPGLRGWERLREEREVGRGEESRGKWETDS